MFVYDRYIRFSETDAAGVVYFSQILNLCHESYEESLRNAGLNLQHFFSPQDTVIPIVHAQVDFRKPLHCGDQVRIQLTVTCSPPHEFEISYQFYLLNPPYDRPIIQALTRHVCIETTTGQRVNYPPHLNTWFALVKSVRPS